MYNNSIRTLQLLQLHISSFAERWEGGVKYDLLAFKIADQYSVFVFTLLSTFCIRCDVEYVRQLQHVLVALN